VSATICASENPDAGASTTTAARDPRLVGGRYRSHHWDCEYTVLGIAFTEFGFLESVTVRDHQGVRIHGTAWDERDEILFHPRLGPSDVVPRRPGQRTTQ
jgi:hypothetical protein